MRPEVHGSGGTTLDKKGQGATDEEIENAKRLRGVANDLFETGMREMADRARALKR